MDRHYGIMRAQCYPVVRAWPRGPRYLAPECDSPGHFSLLPALYFSYLFFLFYVFSDVRMTPGLTMIACWTLTRGARGSASSCWTWSSGRASGWARCTDSCRGRSTAGSVKIETAIELNASVLLLSRDRDLQKQITCNDIQRSQVNKIVVEKF